MPDHSLSQSILHMAQTVQEAFPNIETLPITQVNDDGTIYVARNDWPDGCFLTVPVASATGGLFAGQQAFIFFEDADKQKPFYAGATGCGGGPVIAPVGSSNYISGIWQQGAADEQANFQTFSTIATNGTWIPYAYSGPEPAIQDAIVSDETMEPGGVILMNAQDGNPYAVWLVYPQVAPGVKSSLALNIYGPPTLGNFGFMWQIAVDSPIINRTIYNNDTGINCGFLFADRASGLVWVLGSATYQQTAYIVDIVNKLVVCKTILPISLHQCSCGYGFLAKLWQVPANRPYSTDYPNDRTRLPTAVYQDPLWRFFQFQPADPAASKPAAIVQTCAIDPQTLLPGCQLAYTRAHNMPSGLISSEEGRAPLLAGTAAITGYVQAVQWLSGWVVPSRSIRDLWMNNAFDVPGSGGDTTFTQLVTDPGVLNPRLVGGHRVQKACMTWVSVATGKCISVPLPDNIPSPVQDSASITAWLNYYAGCDLSNLVGDVLVDQWDGFYGDHTWKGLAADQSLELGKPVSILAQTDWSFTYGDGGVITSSSVEQEYDTCATTTIVNTSGLANFPLGAGSGYRGIPGINLTGPFIAPSLKFPDEASFSRSHMVPALTDDYHVGTTGNDESDILIEWDGSEDGSIFQSADPVDSISVDASGAGWTVYFKAIVILEGGGYAGSNQGACLVPQWKGTVTPYQGSAPPPTPTAPAYTLAYTPDVNLYLSPNVRQGAATILVGADPVSGNVVQLDISNYLSYKCQIATGGNTFLNPQVLTTTTASINRNPIDPLLCKPFLIQVPAIGANVALNLLMLVRVWRDALGPYSYDTQHLPYPVVELYDLGTVNFSTGSVAPPTFLQRYYMPDNSAVVNQGSGNLLKWDFLTNVNPFIIKACADGSGNNLPVVEIAVNGFQNLLPSGTAPANRRWQFIWDGTSNLPATINIYDVPVDMNHPTTPQELGSVAFGFGYKVWSCETGNPNGNPFGLMAQQLT